MRTITKLMVSIVPSFNVMLSPPREARVRVSRIVQVAKIHKSSRVLFFYVLEE